MNGRTLRNGEVVFFNPKTGRGLVKDFLGFRYFFDTATIYKEDLIYMKAGRRVLIGTIEDGEQLSDAIYTATSVEIPVMNYLRFCKKERELYHSRTQKILVNGENFEE